MHLLVLPPASLGEVDAREALVSLVDAALDEPGPLHLLEHDRHRRAADAENLREVSLRDAVVVRKLAHADRLSGVNAVLGEQARHQLAMPLHRAMELAEHAPVCCAFTLTQLTVPRWFRVLHQDLRSPPRWEGTNGEDINN